MKFVLTIVAMLGLSTTASAAICQTQSLLSAVLDTNCDIGDKNVAFTGFSGQNLSATDIEVQLTDSGDTHGINFNSASGQGFGAGTSFTIGYTISVLGTDPYRRINWVALDINAPGANASAQKQYTTGEGVQFSLLSSGAPQEMGIAPTTSIDVILSATVKEGILFGVGDTYEQTTVPEPGTYALIGAGLLGVVAFRRRK
ncbi:MAG TPA: PEP-CTERM sorting domain-containing protein [Bryobacteraceae bacterium]|nr:PEP-CTERM sorting domain-containing protein [Bryobacteraceae bacterium]